MFERLLLLCEKYPLDFIAYLSSGLPIIFGLFRYKYLSLTSKLIIIFFLCYFTIEAFGTWLSILKKNNLYLQNIEIAVNIVILLAFGLSCFQSIRWKQISSILAVFCLLISLVTYQSNAVSSVSLSIFRLYALFFCLSYFNKILTDVRVKNILLHTLFWFTTGLLIYSAGTFFIMLFSEYWYKDENKVSAEVFDRYWNANQLLFIFFSVLSAYGLWVSKYDQENLI
ncbi:hypothetical protein EXU85_02135 [Spirosoma sp. KCTC 42546]|nr:hypothetical protein EXU85_02135 [Spirosoma sp. KCTC 42546]